MQDLNQEIKNLLKDEFSLQRFNDFYTGPFDADLRGEYEKGTPEYNTTQQKVDNYLNELTNRILDVVFPEDK